MPLVSAHAARADAASAQQTIAKARAIVRAAVKVRGLRRRRRIMMGVMNRAQIVAHISKRLAQTYSDSEIATDASVLVQLGLLPPGIDYKRAVLALLSDQVAGFYDPKDRRLNIASWLSMSLQKPALLHEICHALQDQHFNLRRFTKPLKDNSDRQLARQAVVEGDCTGVMLEHELLKQGRDLGSVGPLIGALARKLASGGNKSNAWARAPRFLRETLAFPYIEGLKLVAEIRKRSPWSAVSRLFRRVPSSTEQILHYDKYKRRERPVSVRDRDLKALAKTYARVKRDTLGELQLRLLFETALGKSAAERAAAGWGGDRLVAYARKDAAPPQPGKPGALPLIVHLTSWDSDLDAIEAQSGMRRVLRARKLRPLPAESDATRRLWVYGGRGTRGTVQWSLQRAGKHLLLIGGAPAALRRALQREVWQRWRVRGRRVRVRVRVRASGRRK
ncbi:MAG: hypothetical protein KC503_11340 [Myxococcales bacterium]|nr:hypothetical protein [Myxococcales bacterium]